MEMMMDEDDQNIESAEDVNENIDAESDNNEESEEDDDGIHGEDFVPDFSGDDFANDNQILEPQQEHDDHEVKPDTGSFSLKEGLKKFFFRFRK